MALSRKFSVSRYWMEVARNGCTLVQYIGEMNRYLVQHAKEHPAPGASDFVIFNKKKSLARDQRAPTPCPEGVCAAGFKV